MQSVRIARRLPEVGFAHANTPCPDPDSIATPRRLSVTCAQQHTGQCDHPRSRCARSLRRYSARRNWQQPLAPSRCAPSLTLRACAKAASHTVFLSRRTAPNCVPFFGMARQLSKYHDLGSGFRFAVMFPRSFRFLRLPTLVASKPRKRLRSFFVSTYTQGCLVGSHPSSP